MVSRQINNLGDPLDGLVSDSCISESNFDVGVAFYLERHASTPVTLHVGLDRDDG